jgi:hypothetical protein
VIINEPFFVSLVILLPAAEALLAVSADQTA